MNRGANSINTLERHKDSQTRRRITGRRPPQVTTVHPTEEAHPHWPAEPNLLQDAKPERVLQIILKVTGHGWAVSAAGLCCVDLWLAAFFISGYTFYETSLTSFRINPLRTLNHVSFLRAVSCVQFGGRRSLPYSQRGPYTTTVAAAAAVVT